MAAAEDLRANQGVPLHNLPLRRRQTARLEQDMVRNAYLAYIVHWARGIDSVDELSIQTEHPGQLAAVVADASHVSAGVFISVFRRARHGEDGFQIAFLKIGGPFPHSL